MHPPSPSRILPLLLLLGASSTATAATTSSSSTKTAPALTSTSTANAPACTATSSTNSGAFFDLRPDIAVKEDESGKSSHKGAPTADYRARGYDYGKNFTLNICGAVVEPVKDVVGVPSGLWPNTSAYYVQKGEVFSLGSVAPLVLPRCRASRGGLDRPS